MIGIRASVYGDDVIVARFEAAAVGLPAAVNGVTRTFTMLTVTSVQAHASGRPGPNVITGDYRRSWNARFTTGAGGYLVGDAGTSKPQGPRLELGFNGVDSIGRHYNQPPFPHVGPAVADIAPRYEAALFALTKGIG